VLAAPFIACEREITLVTLPTESGGSASGGLTSGGETANSSGGAATGGSTQPSSGGSSSSGGASSGGVADAASFGGATGKSCRDHSDCLTSELCFKNSCDALSGNCDTPPAVCDGTPAPTCGCDGVTYWNDCLRRHAGIPLDRTNECGAHGKPCTSDDACGTQDGMHCAHIGYQQQGGQAGPCGPDLTGSCWAVPANCDSVTDTIRWQECNNGGPPGPDRTCVSTCQAITSGRTYFPAQRCP